MDRSERRHALSGFDPPGTGMFHVKRQLGIRTFAGPRYRTPFVACLRGARVRAWRWGYRFTWNNARVKADAFARAASRVGAELDGRALDRLLAYADLLAERAVPLGMISKADAGRILERHVLDSLRAVPAVSERGPDTV